MPKPSPSPATIFAELVNRVVRGPGTAPMKMRLAASGTGTDSMPREAVPVIEKVRAHAYQVTDADIAALKAAGLDEETIFELVIAAACGVAERRLDRAMEVIDAAG